MKLECAGMQAGSRQQAEHGNWPLEILLQSWAVWKHENPMNLLTAFIYDGLLTCYLGFQVRDSFLAVLDFSPTLFAACSGF